MREKIILIVVLVLVCGGVELWRHNPFSDETLGSDGPGCYTAGSAVLPPIFTGQSAVATPSVPADALHRTSCEVPHGYEIIAYFKPHGAEANCRRRADEFLDGPLAESRLMYTLVESLDEDDTSLGCAVFDTWDTRGTLIDTVGGLRHAMRPPERPAAIACVRDEDDGRYLSYKRCGDFHSGEFAGPAADGGRPEVSCLATVAAFLGLPEAAAKAREELTVFWLETTEPGHLLCFAGRTDGEDSLRSTMRQLGPAPLPTTV